jgi:hypothetical protein
MKRTFAASLLLVLSACAAGPASAPHEASRLWLPLPGTMDKIQYLDFTNHGPEVGELLAQPPYRLDGVHFVPAGATARVQWTGTGYVAVIRP